MYKLVIVFLLNLATITAILAAEVIIPRDDLLTTSPGKAIVIYGQRGRKCGKPPSFKRFIQNRRAVTTKPKGGTLSDGGIGQRYSRACGKDIKARAIVYSPKKGFVGQDEVVFWNADTVVILVREQ